MVSLGPKIKDVIEDIQEDKVRFTSLACACAAAFILALHMSTGFWIALLLTIGVGIVMAPFHGKRVVFAVAGAVCVLTLIFTVGIVASSPKIVSSKVFNKGTETRFADGSMQIKYNLTRYVTFDDGTSPVETLQQFQSHVCQTIDAFYSEFK